MSTDLPTAEQIAEAIRRRDAEFQPWPDPTGTEAKLREALNRVLSPETIAATIAAAPAEMQREFLAANFPELLPHE